MSIVFLFRSRIETNQVCLHQALTEVLMISECTWLYRGNRYEKDADDWNEGKMLRFSIRLRETEWHSKYRLIWLLGFESLPCVSLVISPWAYLITSYNSSHFIYVMGIILLLLIIPCHGVSMKIERDDICKALKAWYLESFVLLLVFCFLWFFFFLLLLLLLPYFVIVLEMNI